MSVSSSPFRISISRLYFSCRALYCSAVCFRSFSIRCCHVPLIDSSSSIRFCFCSFSAFSCAVRRAELALLSCIYLSLLSGLYVRTCSHLWNRLGTYLLLGKCGCCFCDNMKDDISALVLRAQRVAHLLHSRLVFRRA